MFDGLFTTVAKDLITRWLEKGDDARTAEALYNLLGLELRYNINLIDTLADDADQWAPAVLAVAVRLQTDLLTALFLPGGSHDALRKKVDKLKLPAADEDPRKLDGVLKSLWARIRTVQTLAKLGQPPKGMKNVLLLTRLRNLRDSMVQVAVVLSQCSASKP